MSLYERMGWKEGWISRIKVRTWQNKSTGWQEKSQCYSDVPGEWSWVWQPLFLLVFLQGYQGTEAITMTGNYDLTAEGLINAGRVSRGQKVFTCRRGSVPQFTEQQAPEVKNSSSRRNLRVSKGNSLDRLMNHFSSFFQQMFNTLFTTLLFFCLRRKWLSCIQKYYVYIPESCLRFLSSLHSMSPPIYLKFWMKNPFYQYLEWWASVEKLL